MRKYTMNNTLEINLKNREKMIDAIREEIIGPVVDFNGATCVNKETSKEDIEKLGHHYNYSFFYHEHAGLKEEIMVDNMPSRKYAAGLLYPQEQIRYDFLEEDEEELAMSIEDSDIPEESESEGESQDEVSDFRKENKQASMGFTFAVPTSADELHIDFNAGYYKAFTSVNKLFNEDLQKKNNNYIVPWWVRKSVKSGVKIDLNRPEKLMSNRLPIYDYEMQEIEHFDLKIYSYIREVHLRNEQPLKIVTITLSNETQQGSNEEEKILFQCKLTAELGKNQSFEKYPNASDMNANIPAEDQKFEMLYLNEKNYAFGHDCSTNWSEEHGRVEKIETTFLPEYEVKTMTPDIYVDGELLEIHHSNLAGASDFSELDSILNPLIVGYKDWYQKLKNQKVPEYYVENNVKSKNLEEISIAIQRIEKGVELLRDENVREIFQLTNLIMLMQMHSGKNKRELDFDQETGKIVIDSYENQFKNLNFKNDIKQLIYSIKDHYENAKEDSIFKQTKWRGFQIAFLLQSLDSIVNKKSEDRKIVDLIWFPTGGGKTEAYLAVSAFSILYRRMCNPEDSGVDTIMRYTLRLLTADQFQRSSRLIVSLDFLRKQFPETFGEREISIGLWVGTSTTPNTHNGAYHTLLDAEKSRENKFIIEGCPWCGTEMKVIKDRNNRSHYIGYKYTQNKLSAHCPDPACPFHENLPIYFIDEDLYENPPTFLIGTIDKFVQLTWKPEARTLFGLDDEGHRVSSPPTLIIQDELHLISGPLGSLTGMYEPLIYDLCTDKRYEEPIYPKILAATATIKDSEKQIKDVFGMEKSSIFPPSGLDINDNYFSTVLKDEETGEDAPGRKYIGIYTSTQGKLQTQVQAYTALITKTTELPNDEKDPFFTLLAFYNTINDIGKGRTLIEQDIRNNIYTHYQNRGITDGRVIRNDYVEELTSRKNSSEISRFISELKYPYSEEKNQAIDICLASNIIEVGIDIDRLSLMVINGQPKSTSQYIQVSGRIGRKPQERPGLVVTIYNKQNSADKSHFEHFIEYHQKLYAQVETSSVTPFSRFSIKRGLPAVLIAYIRQNFSLKGIGEEPYREFFEDDVNFSKVREFYKQIREKARLVDDSELDFMDNEFARIWTNLEEINYHSWEYDGENNGFMGKITENKEDLPESVQPVIFSMRNVDSQSRLAVKDVSRKRDIKSSRFVFDD